MHSEIVQSQLIGCFEEDIRIFGEAMNQCDLSYWLIILDIFDLGVESVVYGDPLGPLLARQATVEVLACDSQLTANVEGALSKRLQAVQSLIIVVVQIIDLELVIDIKCDRKINLAVKFAKHWVYQLLL